jgi:sorbitol-specific phosphotransferase system component IIA
VTTSTTHGTGQPINVILPDHTIVLMWIVKTEAIRQFSISDMSQAEVELADFEAVILAKQANHVPTFAGATFELNGNAYVIDAVSQSAADVIKRQSIHLKKIWVSARSFFPA